MSAEAKTVEQMEKELMEIGILVSGLSEWGIEYYYTQLVKEGIIIVKY